MQRRDFLKTSAAAGAVLMTPHLAYAEEFVPIGLPAGAPDIRYPFKTVWLEAQQWWRDPGENGVGEHIHFGTAFPLLQTVKTKMRMHFRFLLHGQISTNNAITRFRAGPPGAYLFNLSGSVFPPIKPDSSGNAEKWLEMDVDFPRYCYNGLQEIRFTADMPKDSKGKRRYNSTYWPMYVAGSSLGTKNTTSNANRIGAAGWYTSPYEYTKPFFMSAYPWSPVKGTWAFSVDLRSPDRDVTHYSIHVDPDFHHGHSGAYSFERASSDDGYRGPAAIDTTKLSNGLHKLALITHQDYPEGRNSGVLVMPFTVAN